MPARVLPSRQLVMKEHSRCDLYGCEPPLASACCADLKKIIDHVRSGLGRTPVLSATSPTSSQRASRPRTRSPSLSGHDPNSLHPRCSRRGIVCLRQRREQYVCA
jgi:hypothetical protein